MLEAFERKDFSSALNHQVNFSFPLASPYSLSPALLAHLPLLKLPHCLFLYFPSASYLFLFKAKPIPIVCVPHVSNQDRPHTGMIFLCVPPRNDLTFTLCSKYFCDYKIIAIAFWRNDHMPSPWGLHTQVTRVYEEAVTLVTQNRETQSKVRAGQSFSPATCWELEASTKQKQEPSGWSKRRHWLRKRKRKAAGADGLQGRPEMGRNGGCH